MGRIWVKFILSPMKVMVLESELRHDIIEIKFGFVLGLLYFDELIFFL